MFSCWISGWLSPRCWGWTPQLWLYLIMRSSNYWRTFFTITITITTTFIMLMQPGTARLTRGLIPTKSRTSLTAPRSASPPPDPLTQMMQFPLKKPK